MGAGVGRKWGKWEEGGRVSLDLYVKFKKDCSEKEMKVVTKWCLISKKGQYEEVC